MKPYGARKRPYESDHFKCSRGRADRLPPTADEWDELHDAIAQPPTERHLPAMGHRIGFDIFVSVDDDYKGEDDFIAWAQACMDAFKLPPGVKRVEVLKPEPNDGDVTGIDYR